jgi:hypothetical protein
MTTTFKSGAAVPSGYYFNAARWAIVPVERDGGRLPEAQGAWRRVPVAAALLLTPILGATFLMFLPLVGFILSFQAATAPVLALFAGSAADLAATVKPGWQPGEVHFTGSAGAASVREDAPADAWIAALEQEIAERRRQG